MRSARFEVTELPRYFLSIIWNSHFWPITIWQHFKPNQYLSSPLCNIITWTVHEKNSYFRITRFRLHHLSRVVHNISYEPPFKHSITSYFHVVTCRANLCHAFRMLVFFVLSLAFSHHSAQLKIDMGMTVNGQILCTAITHQQMSSANSKV